MILCSVTTCTIKATTAINNNNNYFFLFLVQPAQSRRHENWQRAYNGCNGKFTQTLTRDYALERDCIIIIITTIYDSVWLVRSSVAVIIKLAWSM